MTLLVALTRPLAPGNSQPLTTPTRRSQRQPHHTLQPRKQHRSLPQSQRTHSLLPTPQAPLSLPPQHTPIALPRSNPLPIPCSRNERPQSPPENITPRGRARASEKIRGTFYAHQRPSLVASVACRRSLWRSLWCRRGFSVCKKGSMALSVGRIFVLWAVGAL